MGHVAGDFLMHQIQNHVYILAESQIPKGHCGFWMKLLKLVYKMLLYGMMSKINCTKVLCHYLVDSNKECVLLEF